ncbi:MAG: HD domain-containing protein [Lachnospiraceae bacterium]|jgi:HD superfamily phosphohydrolase|nr:HD domain-containing protein [uncultured Acetatifactor sp.]MCI9651469.1 HD domain-containing protein [Lachnospiraceae bacterium]
MLDTKEMVFVNYILDNVHGFIGLTFMEDKIERLPIFKRLQDISQLGLVKRIFPGALHNRYIHSLGVMHVIDQMALHLGRFSLAERQLMRLAGLLHDLGHYPLSHDLEQVYDRKESVTAFSITPVRETFLNDVQENLYRLIDKSEETDTPLKNQIPKRELVVKGKYHHETVTTYVIQKSSSIKKIIMEGIREGYFDDDRYLWTKEREESKIQEFAEKIIDDICALIQGNSDYVYEKGAFPEHFTAMLQMLHSELDADRIDYLLRDATFSGASYGAFDLGALLQNLDMKKVCIGHEEVWIVGVKEKGIGCADQYMVNRYLAYTQVIFNKYTSIVGKMLREVVYWMMNSASELTFYSPQKIYSIIEMHEQNEAYLAFTDSYFFEKLHAIEKKKHGCPEDIYFFVEQLRKYQALDVKEEDVFSGGGQQQREHMEKSDLYARIERLIAEKDFSKEKGLYLFNQKRITNHVPYDRFQANFDAYNATHEKKLDYFKYQKDRLMDGLAVIRGTGEPVLLIDAPRSMMRGLYDMQQVMVREYVFPVSV